MSDDKVFLDTNVLVYAYSNILDKKTRALELLSRSHCMTSTQVLGELSNVCFNKLKFSGGAIDAIVENVMSICDIFVVKTKVIQRAIFIKEHYGYSYYDSLILASALKCGCPILYSEDLQHGQIIERSLKIVNPFLA